LHVAAVGHCDS